MKSSINFGGARSSLFGAQNKQRSTLPTYSDDALTSSSGNSHQAMVMREQQEDHSEEEIYQHTNSLRKGVSVLKDISMSINDQISDQNKLLDGMHVDMARTQQSLSVTMKKLGKMMQSGTTRHMCLLVLFVLFVFFAMYALLKMYM